MNRDGSIELPFGDGLHRFALPVKPLEDLEASRKIGPFVLLDRLRDKSCFVGDVREVIRIGLIGAGLPPADAMRLVLKHWDDEPFAARHQLAVAIMLAGLYGPENDPVGKAAAGEAKNSASPASTATASPRASRRKRSAA